MREKKHAILDQKMIGTFLQVESSGNRIETKSGAVRDVQGEHDRTPTLLGLNWDDDILVVANG